MGSAVIDSEVGADVSSQGQIALEEPVFLSEPSLEVFKSDGAFHLKVFIADINSVFDMAISYEIVRLPTEFKNESNVVRPDYVSGYFLFGEIIFSAKAVIDDHEERGFTNGVLSIANNGVQAHVKIYCFLLKCVTFNSL